MSEKNELLEAPFIDVLKSMSINTMNDGELEKDFKITFPEVEFTIHVKNKEKWVEES